MALFIASRLVREPALWLLAAGFCLGAVLALTSSWLKACLKHKKRNTPPKETSPALSAGFFFFLSAAIACGTGAFFAALHKGFLEELYSVVAAGITAGAMSLTFKKEIGLPLLVLVTLASLLAGKSLASWDAAGRPGGGTRILILSKEEDALSVSASSGGREEIIRLAGAAPKIKTEFLNLRGPFRPLAALCFYRNSFISQGEEKLLPPARPPRVWEKILLALPGVHTEIIETEFPPLGEADIFSAYTLEIPESPENPESGGLLIREEQ
jgi:hypothetical protein